jgi:hypothetical protein
MLPEAALTLNRVYTPLYVLDAGGQPGNDQVFYLHPNGCVKIAHTPSVLRATALLRRAAWLCSAWQSRTHCCGAQLRMRRSRVARQVRVPARLSERLTALCAVDFGELLLNEVSGKHKRGGLTLRPETVVARVVLADQTAFSLRAGVRAKLFEVNGRLVSEPQLLLRSPYGTGFVAVLQPFADALAPLQQRALTREAYELAMAARAAPA